MISKELQEFYHEVQCGDFERVRELLRTNPGININYQDENHSSALTLAVRNRSERMVNLLLENKAVPDLNYPNNPYQELFKRFDLEPSTLKILRAIIKKTALHADKYKAFHQFMKFELVGRYREMDLYDTVEEILILFIGTGLPIGELLINIAHLEDQYYLRTSPRILLSKLDLEFRYQTVTYGLGENLHPNPCFDLFSNIELKIFFYIIVELVNIGKEFITDTRIQTDFGIFFSDFSDEARDCITLTKECNLRFPDGQLFPSGLSEENKILFLEALERIYNNVYKKIGLVNHDLVDHFVSMLTGIDANTCTLLRLARNTLNDRVALEEFLNSSYYEDIGKVELLELLRRFIPFTDTIAAQKQQKFLTETDERIARERELDKGIDARRAREKELLSQYTEQKAMLQKQPDISPTAPTPMPIALIKLQQSTIDDTVQQRDQDDIQQDVTTELNRPGAVKCSSQHSDLRSSQTK